MTLNVLELDDLTAIQVATILDNEIVLDSDDASDENESSASEVSSMDESTWEEWEDASSALVAPIAPTSSSSSIFRTSSPPASSPAAVHAGSVGFGEDDALVGLLRGDELGIITGGSLESYQLLVF